MRFGHNDNDAKISTYYASTSDIEAIYDAIRDALTFESVKKQLDDGSTIYISTKGTTGGMIIDRADGSHDFFSFTAIHTYQSINGNVNISTSNIDDDEAWTITIYRDTKEAQN